jgi:hypothetical protein
LCVPRIRSRRAQRQQQGNPTVWQQPVSLTSLSRLHSIVHPLP